MATFYWPSILTLGAMLVMIGNIMLVGHFRTRYGVVAPATTGNAHFERAYRVQMNTIESVLLFLPALWLAGLWGHASTVQIAGATWIVARIVYAFAYIKDPAKRSLGYGLSSFAAIALMVDAAGGVVHFVPA